MSDSRKVRFPPPEPLDPVLALLPLLASPGMAGKSTVVAGDGVTVGVVMVGGQAVVVSVVVVGGQAVVVGRQAVVFGGFFFLGAIVMSQV